MFILKTGHQPGVYVPLRALFLVSEFIHELVDSDYSSHWCCHSCLAVINCFHEHEI